MDEFSIHLGIYWLPVMGTSVTGLEVGRSRNVIRKKKKRMDWRKEDTCVTLLTSGLEYK